MTEMIRYLSIATFYHPPDFAGYAIQKSISHFVSVNKTVSRCCLCQTQEDTAMTLHEAVSGHLEVSEKSCRKETPVQVLFPTFSASPIFWSFFCFRPKVKVAKIEHPTNGKISASFLSLFELYRWQKSGQRVNI